jgi:hypothetical protein
MQQDYAVSAFTMVFVLNLCTQFLKCETLMVCTAVSLLGTMSRCRRLSVRREENAYRGLVHKPEE